jgi:hypothetical protein
MKYQQVYKSGIMISLYKSALKITNSFSNLFLFCFKMYFCFQLMKRSSFILDKLWKKLLNFRKTREIKNFFHYLSVLLSSGLFFGDIFSYYREIYLEERGIIRKFENRNF